MRRVAYVIGGIVVLAIIGSLMGTSAAPRALTTDQRQAAMSHLSAGHLSDPAPTLDLSPGGIVTADFQISELAASGLGVVGLRKVSESRLLAIRDALLPYGFTSYRVNINGPAPSGLVRRYGSSRMLAGGAVEWVTP